VAKKSFLQAMMDAIVYSFETDPTTRVVGPHFASSRPLREDTRKAFFETYKDRSLQPPISESAIASLGAGAAMAGLRPLVNFGTATFAFEAWNQIVNEAANAHFMSGGQITVPVIFHMFAGIRGSGGVQHSQSPQSAFANSPGLQLIMPASPADMQGLLRTAFKSPNPTILINHVKLQGLEAEVPDGDFAIPFGKAEVKRRGKDVTVVAMGLMTVRALAAAEALAREGIDVEVVDLRSIVPLDRDTVIASVKKTGRLVALDEASATCSIASEIVAIVAEAGLALKCPPSRVARPDVPVGYSPPIEDFVTPNVDRITEGVRRAVKQPSIGSPSPI
jgi:pyruvate dehydrogenase E1 component beta subunit